MWLSRCSALSHSPRKYASVCKPSTGQPPFPSQPLLDAPRSSPPSSPQCAFSRRATHAAAAATTTEHTAESPRPPADARSLRTFHGAALSQSGRRALGALPTTTLGPTPQPPATTPISPAAAALAVPPPPSAHCWSPREQAIAAELDPDHPETFAVNVSFGSLSEFSLGVISYLGLYEYHSNHRYEYHDEYRSRISIRSERAKIEVNLRLRDAAAGG